jgi:hypothetical protein
MYKIISIMRGTPVWVWVVLAELLYVGIKATRSRVVYLPTLFIIPVLLLGLKYKTFFSREIVIFMGVVMVSALVSFVAHRNARVEVLKNSYAVRLSGSYSTLVVLLSFFAVKYYFGYMHSTMPEVAAQYDTIETIISGIFSGYFWGRSFSYVSKYFESV